MRKISSILQSIKDCEKKITLERKKGASVRDRSVIRGLQTKHAALTTELSQAHEADRVTPVDKSDNTEIEHKVETEKERKADVKKWEDEQKKYESKKDSS